VKAVIAYQKKVNVNNTIGRNPHSALEMNQEMEKKRRIIVRSFSIAKNLYDSRVTSPLSKEKDLAVGAEFLEVSIYLVSKL
jgi:hypothetical protein